MLMPMNAKYATAMQSVPTTEIAPLEQVQVDDGMLVGQFPGNQEGDRHQRR